MRRPLAYISAAFSANEFEASEEAARYYRTLYELGYAPICPSLYFSLFLKDAVPQEHKDGIDMARDFLRRSRVLVVCGRRIDETVKNEIAVAQRQHITATTLEGLLAVQGQGRTGEEE